MNFTGISDYMQDLLGKKITVVFTSDDEICGDLKEILPDALVLLAESKIAICSTCNINFICEGHWQADVH